ncbi:MAG TPA: hypothetical protein VL987_05415 [Cellvibrio sp.]|nr:hypothetical protein [Cellvibrio sp.]
MKFQHNVVGPDFSKADIVNFFFSEAEVSLVIPQDPDSTGLGYLASQDQTVLPDEPDNHWVTHPFGFRIFDLVSKSWSYIDQDIEDDVAITHFQLNLIEVPETMREEINPLSKRGFVEWLFKFFRMIAVEGDTSLLGTDVELENMKANMMPLSMEEIELHPAGILNWPMLTIKSPYDDDDEANAARDPGYFIYIPLTESLFLYIDHSVSILSSESSPITLPKSEILKLKRDILMEILANIRVTYSPKILALIEECNS